MPDFTSSLYLGMKHGNHELSCWTQLTTGVPAALYEPVQSKYIANYLASMQGCEKGMIAPSTLHLYLDLFDFLCKQKITVFIDEHIYPVSKYGIEKLAVKNVPVYTFKHLNAADLYKLIPKRIYAFTTPVVLTDGFCPQCGKEAPLEAYSRIVKPYKGRIIIDDTQAFGILGKRKDAFVYGYGGGGTLQWLNISDNNVVTVVSLAKAFGVPVAVISGSNNFIKAFESNSKTRESSSPVSFAHLGAAKHAIFLNTQSGAYRRKKLLDNILLTKKQLMDSGITLNKGLFPVQSIVDLTNSEAMDLHKKLDNYGFRTVLLKDHTEMKTIISFVINYNHSKYEIQSLANIIKQFLHAHTK